MASHFLRDPEVLKVRDKKETKTFPMTSKLGRRYVRGSYSQVAFLLFKQETQVDSLFTLSVTVLVLVILLSFLSKGGPHAFILFGITLGGNV